LEASYFKNAIYSVTDITSNEDNIYGTSVILCI